MTDISDTRTKGVRSRIKGLLPKGKRLNRLASDIRVFEPLLEKRIKSCQELSKERKVDLSWVEPSRRLLEDAKKALQDNDLTVGWKCFNAARQLEIFCCDDDELNSRAATLRSEAKKLSSWRQKAVEELLKEPVPPGSAKRIYEAAVIRDEHFDNKYFKIDLILFQRVILLCVLGAAVIAFMLLVGSYKLSAAMVNDSVDLSVLVAVALFGAMGASISATQSLGKMSAYISGATTLKESDVEVKIPEQIASAWITLTRPGLGAASAIVVYFFILSDINPFKTANNTFTTLSIAFVAGFSERLIIQLAESIKIKR